MKPGNMYADDEGLKLCQTKEVARGILDKETAEAIVYRWNAYNAMSAFLQDFLYSKTGECDPAVETAPYTDEQLCEKARTILAKNYGGADA